jgi:DNA-binding response OmpR family regulator
MMSRQAANENWASQTAAPDDLSSGVLHVIGMPAMLRVLPEIRSERERFLCMLRSRPVLTHADAIEALWGEDGNGGPLYAQHILAIYVSRLRRAGYLIENYQGFGYRLRQPALQAAD